MTNVYSKLWELIEYEPEENKLSMLTAIGLETQNEEIFKATEELRERYSKSISMGQEVTEAEIHASALRNSPIGKSEEDCLRKEEALRNAYELQDLLA